MEDIFFSQGLRGFQAQSWGTCLQLEALKCDIGGQSLAYACHFMWDEKRFDGWFVIWLWSPEGGGNIDCVIYLAADCLLFSPVFICAI